jgi:hypothetical protein
MLSMAGRSVGFVTDWIVPSYPGEQLPAHGLNLHDR